jgi:hypothetical protein
MKRTIFFIIAITVTIISSLNAQENKHKYDFKVGAGLRIMGKTDLNMCYENELNYKLNDYVSSSVSLGFGRSVEYLEEHNAFIQASFNLFVSPFKNYKRNNFKIGLGFTHINDAITYIYSTGDSPNSPTANNPKYTYFNYAVTGFNLIVENEYQINSKFLIGGKLFASGLIFEGHLFSAAMIKMGIIL